MALVPGGGSAGFRALHDGAAIGRAELPPTSPTAFVQADLKNGSCSGILIVCLCFCAQVQVLIKKVLKLQTIGNSFSLTELGSLNELSECE
jgi:hypothetical protein